MSITATIAALQTLHAGVSGIVTASTTYPSQLNAAMLPQVVVWTSTGQWSRGDTGFGGAPIFQQRTYRVQVFISPISLGIKDDRIQLMHALQQRFGELYINNFALTNGTYQATVIADSGSGPSDSGDGTLQYQGTTYQGFEFTVHVLEKS